MRENTVKAKWRAGEMTYGAWLSIPSSFSAEVAASLGYDYVCVDTQHGVIDYSTAVPMLQMIGASGSIPFIRVPFNDFSYIGKALDAGAMGVVVPMVNNVQDARAAVNACRYYPEGARSYGPTRVSFYFGDGYYQAANREVALCVQIETTEALANLDAILSVPGVDAVYVGPQDLSITLGLGPGLDNGGVYEEARLNIAAACKAHGVVAGMHANASLAPKHKAAGYQMVTICGDHRAMMAAMETDLAQARRA